MSDDTRENPVPSRSGWGPCGAARSYPKVGFVSVGTRPGALAVGCRTVGDVGREGAEAVDLWVLIAGLVMLALALPVAGRRVFFLFRLITSGQPAPDRVENVTKRLGAAIKSQVV